MVAYLGAFFTIKFSRYALTGFKARSLKRPKNRLLYHRVYKETGRKLVISNPKRIKNIGEVLNESEIKLLLAACHYPKQSAMLHLLAGNTWLMRNWLADVKVNYKFKPPNHPTGFIFCPNFFANKGINPGCVPRRDNHRQLS